MQLSIQQDQVKTGPYGAVLIVTHNGLNTLYDLKSSFISIGRHRENHIVIADKNLSRHHAYFWKMGCGDSLHFQFVDGNLEGAPSSNGSFVNDRRVVGQEVLTNGDMLSFGPKIKARYLCQNRLDADYLDILKTQYRINDTVEIHEIPTLLSPDAVTTLNEENHTHPHQQGNVEVSELNLIPH